MLFEKLWRGACNVLKAGTGQETCLHVITCLPLVVPEPLDADLQPPACITVVLPSNILFSSPPLTESKSQSDTEERRYSPKRVGEVSWPDLHILFMGWSGPMLCPESAEETYPIPGVLQVSPPCLSGSPHGDNRWPEHKVHELCLSFLSDQVFRENMSGTNLAEVKEQITKRPAAFPV